MSSISDETKGRLLSVFRTPEATNVVVTAINEGLVLPVGGTGADVTLSNLTAPTAVPVNLLPATNGNRDLGGTNKAWQNVYTKYGILDENSAGVIATNGIRLLTDTNGANMLNFSTSGSINFYGNQVLNAGYTPTTPADWSPAPTSIKEALDQLAARIAALEP